MKAQVQPLSMIRWLWPFVVGACVRPIGNPRDVSQVDGLLNAFAGQNRSVGAPDSLEGRPWRIGQWAIYQQTGGPERRGYEVCTVAAEEECGTWVTVESQDYFGRHNWRVCVAPTSAAQIGIWESNGDAPRIIDLRRKPTLDQLQLVNGVVALLRPMHDVDGANLSREDLDVPAGHFAQVVRITDQDGTRWVHPAVPFDGTVKRHTKDGHDYVLVAYGDAIGGSLVRGLASEVAGARSPKPSPPTYMALGGGIGAMSGHASEHGSGTSETDIIIGARVSANVDAIADVGVTFADTYSPDPSISQSTFEVLLGARWAPWRLPYLQPRTLPVGLSALFIQADAGYIELSHDTATDTHTVARGVAAGASIGWLGVQAHDWGLGLAGKDQVMFFNSGEGIRNDIAFIVFWQLYWPW